MDISRIHAMKESLTEWAKSEIDKGKDCVNTCEMGQVIDMIKDLASAEKDCYEAKYYKEIHESMEDYKEKEECGAATGGMPWYLKFLSDGKAGYDNWRYPSSGRFAPTGSGRRYGYMPEWYDPMMHGASEWNDGRMGYDGPSDWRTGSTTADNRTGYGMTPYDRYKEAKRHYTETHSPQDKSEMDEHAKKHLETSIQSFRDIWQGADPELKKRMKANLGSLVNEMNV